MATDAVLAYPAPVADRTGPGPTNPAPSIPGALAPPRQRIFPFAINEVATRRTSVCTPKLVGPVIIQGFSINQGTRAEPANNTTELGWSSVPVVENNVVLTTPRPYTLLTELLDPQAIVADDRGGGFPMNTLSSPDTRFPIPLGIIIDAAEVYVVVADVNPSAFVQHIYGYLQILEAVPRDTLLAFH